jgi:hypothetical protein
MTIPQLKKEMAYWQMRARFLGPKVAKLVLKRVHEIQRMLERRQSEQGSSTQV